MREIRFRVWSIFSKKMFDDGFYLSLDGGLFENDDLDYKNKSSFEIMQYTGLKDKNGKEIYEGDVVKGQWWACGKSHRHIGVVTYVMNAFKVRGVKQYIGLDDGLNSSYEVIGNIYENHELLEAAK